MKIFTNSGSLNSHDIVHIPGENGDYIITENNDELTYESVSMDRKYILSNSIETLDFRFNNEIGFRKFSFEDELDKFNIRMSCEEILNKEIK